MTPTPRHNARPKLGLRAAALALALLAPAAHAQQEREDEPLTHDALFAPNTTFPYFQEIDAFAAVDPAAFSVVNAALLAQCSMLVYVREPDFIRDTLLDAGFTDVQILDRHGTFAFVAEKNGRIAVAFRGTESGDRTDYLTDAKIAHVRFTEDGRAHAGFVGALAHVASELDQSLQRRLAEADKSVWLAGHSMGAALATLYAIQNPDTVDAVYTIGSPRVVNRKLADRWHDALPLFRLVNNNDLVARLPTPPFYEHIGPTYFLGPQGQLLVDPPLSKIWKKRLRGHGEYLQRVYRQHWSEADFSAIPSAAFADHSPRLYVEALIGLAQPEADDRQTNP